MISQVPGGRMETHYCYHFGIFGSLNFDDAFLMNFGVGAGGVGGHLITSLKPPLGLGRSWGGQEPHAEATKQEGKAIKYIDINSNN